MNYWDVFDKGIISEAYEVVGEWEVWVQHQKVKIKIKRNQHGTYFYSNSHHYHGPNQAGPYISSNNMAGSLEEALRNAVREITSFLTSDNMGGTWVPSSSY